MNKQVKGFAHLFLLLIVVVIGVVGYCIYTDKIPFQKETPIENIAVRTADWETYVSTSGEFSFSYPSSWKLEKNISSYKEDLTIRNKEYTENAGTDRNHGVVTFQVSLQPSESLCGLPCKDMTESQFFSDNDLWKLGDIGGGGPGTTVDSVTDVTIGGKKARLRIYHPSIDYEFSSPVDKTYEYYIYLDGDNGSVLKVDFEIRDSFPDKEQLLQIANQILSTFKFTK